MRRTQPASTKPISDDHTLKHDQTHRVGPGRLLGDREGHERVEPKTGGERQREVGDDTHEDRHDPGDEGGASGDGREVRLGSPTEELPVAVLHETQNDRVEHDDVGHREERDEAAAHLSLNGGSPLGDLEVVI